MHSSVICSVLGEPGLLSTYLPLISVCITSNSVYRYCLQSLDYCGPRRQKPSETNKASLTPRVICVFYCRSSPAHAATSVSQGQYTDGYTVMQFLSPFSRSGLRFFFSTKEKIQLLRSRRGWQAIVPCGGAAFTIKTTTPTGLCLVYVQLFTYKKVIKHLSALPIWVVETVSYWWLDNFRTSMVLCSSTLHVPKHLTPSY